MRAADPIESTPLSAVHGFTEALSRGDVPVAAAWFTRGACLVTPDGTAIHGRAEIAAILAQMAARRTEIEAEQLVLRTAGDVCLASGRFTMRSDGPEGARYSQTCAPLLTLQRLEERWKIAILSPWTPQLSLGAA